MPITVTAPRGVLTTSGRQQVLPRLSRALIEISGAAGNAFFTPIVGGHVDEVEPADVYAGGANRPLVVVKLEIPNIALGSVELRAAFIRAATDIVGECTVPWHEPENTWVNIFNAPDGGWGIAGRAYTGDDLVAAITAAAQ
ncbi:tautomerase family protein [Dactylosporangium darangshiense]|uniref:Tautomerase enzyme n=1 Tax=Dactylosporangium darangshiense TaxID=579108 RepID=A0ABP8D0S3_9ACTN